MEQKRVVVITGGASGIGRETAQKFAQKGDQVIIADIDIALGAETVHWIQGSGGEAIFIPTDVRQMNEVTFLIEKTIETFGRIDILFNNAGVSHLSSLLELDLDAYQRVIEINQHGVAHGIVAAGKAMKRLGTKGLIINMASVLGIIASPGNFAYHASKGAVIMMTKSASLELADDGIRVIAVAPGPVDTPILQEYEHIKDEKILRAVKGQNAITEPSKIADMVYLLSLPEADILNGSVVMLDEGYTAFK
ncbi:SDR family NAD(P)-dependent oxidoreductase [Bacillus toyonensis]|uniref:SDR family NAD(P)-dependent oxidoreductase n=1 Tax=Bacillus toyonensis TaxID=155322 RepID=UPI000BF8B177|nr:SDR family oxidoreductase [Bacillus toyonensis]PGC82019.1 short-chain dehydrogenase [Bacillus toyonensis]